jgi:mannose-6-phosphate isomerase-like protein (cupin superfamily)
MSLDPQETYVLLTAEGTAAPLPGGDAFWALPDTELATTGAGWLVSEFLFASDWPSWEMHPDADEFVYLISGDAVLHLEHADGVKVVALSGSGAVIVPRGVWHTAKISAPSRMLHVTRGSGTQVRPV